MGSFELVRPAPPFATTCSMPCLAPTTVALLVRALCCGSPTIGNETTVRHHEAYQGEGSEGKRTSVRLQHDKSRVRRARRCLDVGQAATFGFVLCYSAR